MNSLAAAIDTAAETPVCETNVTETDMANAIRALAMDSVQKANSGHPGMPMGMADVATVLFNRFITLDPSKPDWPDRDRFVLSAGHGSMLQYALHHLIGYPGHADPGIAAFPPARQPHGRPSRTWSRARHRDDDRAARPGPCRGRRHGARRTHDGGALRPGTGRSPHLCHRRRRLPAGRDQPRGDRPCRPSEARSPDRAVGRQFDLDRRPDVACHLDGPAGAFRGRRLERAARRRPRHGSRRRGARGSAALRSADADRLPHDDRQGRAQPAGLGKDAWRAAGRGRDRRRQAQYRLGASALRSARRDRLGLARSRRTRKRGAPRLGAAARAIAAARGIRNRDRRHAAGRPCSKRSRRSARSISTSRPRSPPARHRKWCWARSTARRT